MSDYHHNIICNGFTLLELLITVSIISIVFVMLIIIINPVEVIKKSRDSQRISDLKILKTAIAVYATSTSTPNIDGSGSLVSFNTRCKPQAGWNTSTARVWYSYPIEKGIIARPSIIGATVQPVSSQVSRVNIQNINGSGWVPINFTITKMGAVLSGLPLDPLNYVANRLSPRNTDYIYRYVCFRPDLSFELNARLESDEYVKTKKLMENDGGDNINLYEVGTRLNIIGNGNY